MSATVRQILDQLNNVERRRLMVAFDNNIAQFVEYSKGRYIGVFAERIPVLISEQTAGYWSTGAIRQVSGE